MQVSQSAEAKIALPRSPPPLTMARLSQCSCKHTQTNTAHTSVHAEVSREQEEQLRGIQQTSWLTFSKAGVMLLSFIDI